MRWKNKISLLLPLLLLQVHLIAQSKETAPTGSLTGIREKIILSTDRSVYFAGEPLLFKANCFVPGLTNIPLSTVLYLELYDQQLKPVLQQKEQIINGISAGSIEIPSYSISGNYYLRAYTLYMRNFPKEFFYTSELTIINPELPSKEAFQTIRKNNQPEEADTSIGIKTSQEIYAPRSLITIDLTGNEKVNLSVSVVKKGSYQKEKAGMNTYFKADRSADTAIQLMTYPEIRPLSISGKVIDAKNSQALKGVLVYVSIKEKNKQFHVTRTKADGTFMVSLPNVNESQQVYICTQKQTDLETKVLINNDFATAFISPAYIPEIIDSAKISLINEMYMNQQVTTAFNNSIPTSKKFLPPLPDPFDEDSKITFMKDYIALNSMTEILDEIVAYTKVKKKKNQPYIEVSDRIHKEVMPQALILLDNVPFHDHTQLLSLSPSSILSVAVIAEPYVYGGEVLNGIVNIKSVNGDFGGLELPKDVSVVEYITYNPEQTVSFEKFQKKADAQNKAPDFRNTLYWNPNVVLENGKQSLKFYSADHVSYYEIIVKGMNNKGELIFKTKTIRVAK